jgi:hypothetical protein
MSNRWPCSIASKALQQLKFIRQSMQAERDCQAAIRHRTNARRDLLRTRLARVMLSPISTPRRALHNGAMLNRSAREIRAFAASGGMMATAAAPDISVPGSASTAVEQIARSTGHPVDLVQEVYERTATQLASGAKITQFVGVIATRQVLLALREH